MRSGLNQTQLGERLGITQAAISAWETGNSYPRPSMRKRINDLLGVDVDFPGEQPLTLTEQRELLDCIDKAAQRLGYQKVLSIFADKNPNELRELCEFILSQQVAPLPPPGTRQ